MVKKQAPINIVGICEEIILSFNPTTHSIDTHVLEKVGDTNKPVRTLYFDTYCMDTDHCYVSQDARPDDVLIQQVVYGCFKEKPLLKVRKTHLLHRDTNQPNADVY